MGSFKVILFCIFLRIAATEFSSILENDTKILSRRKRYVVFPQGSSFSVAFCMTFKTLTQDDIFTGGVNVGVNFDLPNETKHEATEWTPFEPSPQMLRRRRRDAYHKLETVLETFGLQGRACILRSICETSQMLIPNDSLATELLRVVFTLPLARVREREPDDHHLYDRAHRAGLANVDCSLLFAQCPISLLDMALG